MKMQLISGLRAVCLAGITGLAAPVAFTQTVAYVYVSHQASTYAGLPNDISAWSADSTGRLTRIPGSPYKGSVGPMAVNGKYLFGTDTDGSNIDSFLISSTGALSQVDTFNVMKYTGGACQQPIDVTLDHTGSTLYAFSGYYATDTSCPTEPSFQSLEVNKSTGALTYLGKTITNDAYNYPLRFTPGNVYAYEASGTAIYGFKRQSNGDLVYYDTTKTLPAAPSGHQYVSYDAAADPYNHLAVLIGDYSTTSSTTYPSRVAVYDVSSTGTLTTSSTTANMPTLSIGLIYYSNMSPSGKLLAVSGQKGLQVLHFNGSSPATPYTGLLVNTSVDKMFWDNANHLYALSELGNKLYVFTVTPTGYSQAPGSPYTVYNPDSLIVQPK